MQNFVLWGLALVFLFLLRDLVIEIFVAILQVIFTIIATILEIIFGVFKLIFVVLFGVVEFAFVFVFSMIEMLLEPLVFFMEKEIVKMENMIRNKEYDKIFAIAFFVIFFGVVFFKYSAYQFKNMQTYAAVNSLAEQISYGNKEPLMQWSLGEHVDNWGNSFCLDANDEFVQFRSKGPDGIYGNQDDIVGKRYEKSKVAEKIQKTKSKLKSFFDKFK